ncbi:MAG TPA: hypothetical protein VF846_12800 [Thermoanaerobaculia bacterium]
MINILNVRVFFYDQDRKSVTVYGDFDDPNMYYIVPQPQFALREQQGMLVPQFSLTEYKTTGGTEGTCAFTVELAIPADAKQAAERNLPPGAQFGQFRWLQAEAFLRFSMGGREVVLNSAPSLYGNNEATFVVQLNDQQEVNTFRDAFKPGSGIGPTQFHIQYQVLVLSKLPAVNVRVTYDSVIAVDYQKQIEVSKNVWGQETSRRASIQENLRKSDAGDVTISWSMPDPDAETQQRVYDWAWVTLENLVSTAMDDAMRTVGERNFDQFSLTSTASFARTYNENQVIEWAITPGDFLPNFTPEIWALVYRVVENRRLVVNFTILDSLEAAGIQSVSLTMHYPTAETGNTYLFKPTGPSSWTADYDGTNPFDPAYWYEYTVTFNDGTDPFHEARIDSTATQVVLPVADLGIQTAAFIGSNIDFGKTVDFVLIDFFFARPDGENTVEQVRMIDNINAIEIVSRTHLRSANNYSYQLTYVMKNGARYVVAPRSVFQPQNRQRVTIVSPFVERQANVYISNPTAADPKIFAVDMVGRYADPLNDFSGLENGWNFEPDLGKIFTSADDKWKFAAVDNVTGSFIEYNGTIFYEDGSTIDITDLVISRTPSLILNATLLPFTVEIDPRNVAWDEGVASVDVHMFRSAKEVFEGQQANEALAGDQTAISVLTFLPPPKDGTGQFMAGAKQYYTFSRPIEEAVSYFWSAIYFHTDGATRSVEQETASVDRITLPDDGTSPDRVVNLVAVAPLQRRQADGTRMRRWARQR